MLYIFAFLVILCIKRWNSLLRLNNKIEGNPIYNDKNIIRMLNYNIFLRSCGISDNFKNGNFKNERLEYFINNYLDNYDIVLLQGCFNTLSFKCKYLIERAERLGFKYYVLPENPDFLSKKIIDSGLVILSKIPIRHTETHIFNKACYIDSYVNKGFQYCKLLLKDTTLHIINTHIQSDYYIADNKANIVKLSQINQISEFIQNINQDDPIILAGDLNCNSIYIQNNKPICYSYSSLYNDMLEILNYTKNNDLLRLFNKMRAATSHSVYRNGIEINTNCYMPQNQNNTVCLPRSIDYIFYNHNKALTCMVSKIKKIEYNNKSLSDHSAIETIFHVN